MLYFGILENSLSSLFPPSCDVRNTKFAYAVIFGVSVCLKIVFTSVKIFSYRITSKL